MYRFLIINAELAGANYPRGFPIARKKLDYYPLDELLAAHPGRRRAAIWIANPNKIRTEPGTSRRRLEMILAEGYPGRGAVLG